MPDPGGRADHSWPPGDGALGATDAAGSKPYSPAAINRRVRRGFKPERLEGRQRPRRLIPQILGDERVPEAKGFTEINIIGVGGAGNNALNRMIAAHITGVQYIAVNTDAQALSLCDAPRKVHIGRHTAKRLGAGGDPAVGERAAEESMEELEATVAGADMVFVTAGMGGGTGSGAAPVIAQLARRRRILTVGVVSLPFSFEGKVRSRTAEGGVVKLKATVDALIVIPNDRLLALAGSELSMVDAFRRADNMLRHGVQGVAELVTVTGLINLDLADVKAVMSDSGTALMAIGEGSGQNRAIQAAQAAISSPLLDTPIDGARGILLNITGGPDLALHEVEEVASLIASSAHPDANLVIGAVVTPRPEAEMRVTLIATGFDGGSRAGRRPTEVSMGERAPTDSSRVEVRAPSIAAARQRAAAEPPRWWSAPREPIARERDVPPFLRRRNPAEPRETRD